MITLAIARGRLLDESSDLLKKAGYPVGNIIKDSRKLVFEFPKQGLKILIIRPTDVPQYVDRGAADIGFVGKDTLISLAFV